MGKIRPTSLILSDWGAYGTVYRSPKKLVNDLIVLSLLYDQILIQDEVFVLSDTLPKWFRGPKGYELLDKIFQLDSIVLLAWPASAYTSNIDTDPRQHPIEARAEWHEKNSTKGDQIFIPSELHKRFYKRLEGALLLRKTAIRERGKNPLIDVGESYRSILSDVLGREVYKPWLKYRYPSLSADVRDNILKYLANPSEAVRDLVDRGHHVNALLIGNAPVFNRSLGFQVSKLYGDDQRLALQSLLQSVYAIPLSESEEAVGRYSGRLREVPLFTSSDEIERYTNDKTVKVEAVIDTKLSLPSIFDDFPAIINEVRRTKQGKALRKAYRDLGQETDFRRQLNAWSQVSDVLSTYTKKDATHNARTVLFSSLGKIGLGTVIGLALKGLASTPDQGLSTLAGTVASQGLGVCYDHVLKSLNHHLHTIAIQDQLENAVKIRCTWIPYFTTGSGIR